MKKLQLALAAAATLAVAQAAHATITATSSVGGGAPSGTTNYDLNNLPLGSTGGTVGNLSVSFTGTGKVVEDRDYNPTTYAEPWFSGNNDTGFGGATGRDDTKYITTGTGSAILTFTTPLTYLGFVWGSVDDYNTITFWNGTEEITSFTPPTTGIPLPAPGGDQNINGTFWVNFNSTTAFDKVVLTSSGNAFEIDNIATVAVPEPSTYIAGALLLVPFAAGAIRSLRTRKES